MSAADEDAGPHGAAETGRKAMKYQKRGILGLVGLLNGPQTMGRGWLFWGEFPGPMTGAGIALIAGSGIYVFLREKQRKRPLAVKRPTRRW